MWQRIAVSLGVLALGGCAGRLTLRELFPEPDSTIGGNPQARVRSSLLGVSYWCDAKEGDDKARRRCEEGARRFKELQRGLGTEADRTIHRVSRQEAVEIKEGGSPVPTRFQRTISGFFAEQPLSLNETTAVDYYNSAAQALGLGTRNVDWAGELNRPLTVEDAVGWWNPLDHICLYFREERLEADGTKWRNHLACQATWFINKPLRETCP